MSSNDLETKLHSLSKPEALLVMDAVRRRAEELLQPPEGLDPYVASQARYVVQLTVDCAAYPWPADQGLSHLEPQFNDCPFCFSLHALREAGIQLSWVEQVIDTLVASRGRS